MKRCTILFGLGFLFLFGGIQVARAADDDGFVPLFDGKTLDGWSAMPGGTWTVEDGAIVGRSPRSERRHGLLVTDRTYGDFTVRAKFKVIRGNSGFYFRSEKVQSAVGVNGFQAEVENGTSVGGLYETGGRAWVVKPGSAIISKIYKPGEWNDLVVTARGRNITVQINGTTTAQLTDDPGRLTGHIALQLHGGQDMEVMFRDIAIKCDPPAEPKSTESTATTALLAAAAVDDDGFVPMFNGSDLTGWKTTGNWVVEPDGIVRLIPRPGEHGWQRYDAYITTERKYKDFVIDLEFKIEKAGNSGVFLRVGDTTNHVRSGFEVQILDTHGKANPGSHDCGGVIGTSGPSKNMALPAGEWNRYTITVKGSQLTVVLNGEQIQDLDLSTSAIKDRPLEGYIAFQDEGRPLWYRNVRIKELK